MSLITSKSKIASKHRITIIPRLELNGVVLCLPSDFVVSQVDLEFCNVYHLVNSSKIVPYLNMSD